MDVNGKALALLFLAILILAALAGAVSGWFSN